MPRKTAVDLWVPRFLDWYAVLCVLYSPKPTGTTLHSISLQCSLCSVLPLLMLLLLMLLLLLLLSQVDDVVSTEVEQTVVSLSAAKMDEVSEQ